MRKESSVKVHIENKYVSRDYPSMEEAARMLATIGTLTTEEILKMMRKRVGYINGYVVTYSDGGTEESQWAL